MGFFDRFFKPPSKAKFARMVIAALAQRGEPGPWKFDEERFQLQRDDRLLNLGGIYGEYLAQPPKQRAAYFARAMLGIQAHQRPIPQDFELAKVDVLPVVRSRVMLAHLQQPFSHHVLAEHFVVGLVYDWHESMMYVLPDQLEQWGVDFDTALEAAGHSLLERSGYVFEQPLPGLWVSPFADNYDTSRLLLSPVVEHHAVQGETVAFLPHRDRLILCGSDDEPALTKAIELVKEALQHPRPLSTRPLVLRDGRWTPFALEPEHALAEPLGDLLRIQSWRDYEETGAALRQQQGDATFVAAYTLVEPQGKLRSYAVWSKGVRTLLPRSDLVAFATPQAGGTDVATKIVTWEDAEQAVGYLLQPQDAYPQRFLVEGFPTAEELASIAPFA